MNTVQMDAISIANELFESNKFQTHKQLEAKLNAMKEEFKTRMKSDEMRKEFVSQDLVLKYIRENVYDIDTIGLNEMLHQYGLLIPAAKVSTKDKTILSQIEEFKNQKTYHIRIYANVKKETFDFSKHEIFQLVDEFNKANILYKRLTRQINKAKEKMLQCKKLQKEEKQMFKYGSFGLVKNKDSYNIEGIYKKFGVDFIINCTSPSFEKVNEYIQQGFINKKEVNQFKTITNIILKFVVMSLSDEQFVYNMISKKNQYAA